MHRSLIAILLVLFAIPVLSQTEAPLNRDPKTVKFVTSDIDNFWRAYDLAAKETDRAKRVAIFQTEYLDKGSAGLKDFLRLRIGSADNLVKTIDRLPKYYASMRGPSLTVKTMEKGMRKAFAKFNEQKPAVRALYTKLPLEDGYRRRALDYLDDFYHVIGDQRQVKRELIETCVGRQTS